MADENENVVATEEEIPEQDATEEPIEGDVPEEPEAGEVAEEEAAQEGEPEPDKTEYSRNVQRRMNELTKKRREAERKAARLEAENAALKRKTEAGPRPQRPDPEDFRNPDTDEIDFRQLRAADSKYDDDLYAWRRAQETPAAVPQQETEEPDSELVSAYQEFDERADSVRAQHKDFDDVISNPVFNESADLAMAIYESEVGPQVAYWLGKNPREVERLNSMPIDRMNREFGKLEARFSAPARRTRSQAPAPIKPVGGNAPATKDPEKMSDDEWIAQENLREAKKKGIVPGG